MRAQQLDTSEREAMEAVLEHIERAAATVAAELGADVRVERDDRGRFPLVIFRAHGFGFTPASSRPRTPAGMSDTPSPTASG